MAAEKGNKYWQMRAKDGKPKAYPTPELLWEGAVAYFEWVDENPLWEHKVFNYQGDIVETQIPKMRAMTIEGLSLHLGVSRVTLKNYESDKDYLEVTDQISAVIREQKFTGASSDLLNANIIARDLGLRDAKDIKHDVAEGVSFNVNYGGKDK